jgi:hypothetical protein
MIMPPIPEEQARMDKAKAELMAERQVLTRNKYAVMTFGGVYSDSTEEAYRMGDTWSDALKFLED